MNKQEKKCLKLTAKLWNEFLKLPVLHNDDTAEFKFSIHALQKIIQARPELKKQKK